MAKKKENKYLENEKDYSINFSLLEEKGFSVEFLIGEKLSSVGVSVKSSDKVSQLLILCAKFKKTPYDFILPELSLSESIVRSLLIRKNQKTPMHQIQSDLSAVWLDHFKLPYKNLSDIGIRSILDRNELFNTD